jgi:flagellar M-ring protein FliF
VLIEEEPNPVQRAVEQFMAFFAGLGVREKRIFVGASVASLVALLAVFWWAAQENWQPVYTSSDPGDVQAAAAVLEANKIPFKVSDNGLQLLTTPSNVGRARIESASAGRVAGFESLAEIKLGTSPQRERWAYQNALQGELVRTINSLDEVEMCRVHLVLPQRSAFLREDRPASASVTLKLLPGRRLRKAQVVGISALVGGAVDGLDAGNVVIVDHKGRMLSSPQDGDENTMGLTALFEARQAYESRYRQTIEGALAPILGDPNAISVAVTVDLDPTMIESTTREMNPDTQVTISEEVREEDSSNQTAGGIPGTESNLPETTGATQGSTNRSVAELSTNYDYTTTQRRTVQPAGKIERVSVSVMVNNERMQELAGGEAEGDALESLKKQIDEAVRVAMGYDQTRGDSVAVSFVPFSVELVDEDDMTGSSFDIQDYEGLIVAILGLILLVWFVARPVLQAMSGTARDTGGGGVLTAARGMGVEQVMDEEGMSLAERLRLLVDNFEPVEAQDLNRLVELQEDASAQVLRRWVHS